MSAPDSHPAAHRGCGTISEIGSPWHQCKSLKKIEQSLPATSLHFAGSFRKIGSCRTYYKAHCRVKSNAVAKAENGANCLQIGSG